MKKNFYLTIALLLMVCNLPAQTVQTNPVEKSFFSDIQYIFSIGYTLKYSEKPFDTSGAGFTIGLDVKKVFLSLSEGKTNVYGLVGCHFVQRGGKQYYGDLYDFLDDDKNFSSSQISVPLHVGVSYKFKKLSLFIDGGPYIAYCLGITENRVLTKKSSFDLGLGLNMGIKFKRFGLSCAFEHGFMNLAEYRARNDDSMVEPVNLNGKLTALFRLQWTFGKK